MGNRWTIGRLIGCLASLLWTWSVVASCGRDGGTVHARDVEAWTKAVDGR